MHAQKEVNNIEVKIIHECVYVVKTSADRRTGAIGYKTYLCTNVTSFLSLHCDVCRRVCREWKVVVRRDLQKKFPPFHCT